jgi:predicted TIM-barrel fold metal-dependent hydrolase
MAPLITLEEHFYSKAIRADTGMDQPISQSHPQVLEKLHSISEDRIRDMDSGRVSLQIISHTPTQGSASPSTCRTINDELHIACKANPSRFAGFASLPMAEPTAAADELSRCVKDLAFVGALIDNHCAGRMYDDEFFWPVFERAAELDVPVYLHPDFPPEDLAPHYRGNFSEGAAMSMSIAGWGWHSETALHVLRLFASGLFDRFPKLKIIIGHMGEMLPFQLDRVVRISARWGKRERGLKQVWDENLWITTSGMFSLAPMACLLRSTRVERILYSVDYPFSDNEMGMKFMEELERSGMVSGDGFEMIAYKNAEKLLKIKL